MAPDQRYAAIPIRRLTLKQLIMATNNNFPEIIKRANTECHVIRKDYSVGSREGFKRIYRPDRGFYNELRLYSTCTDGKRFSYVRMYGPPDANTPSWVWCSCPYFTFNCEVALARFNSSTVKLSNGQLPVERNPRMIPHLCKHLINAVKIALQQKDDLAAQRMQAQEEGKGVAAAFALKRMAQKPEGKRIPPRRFVSPPSDFVEIP